MSCVAVIFVMICLTSLHACNSRLLASNDNQIGHKAYLLVTKKVEMAKELSDETSNPSNVKPKTLEDKNLNERNSHRENLGTSTCTKPIIPNMPQKSDQSATDTNDKAIITSGNGITKSLSHIDDQFTKSTREPYKGQKGQARSMLGFPQDTEEAIDAKESDTTNTLLNDDNIDMMDYAQPHRKPPIHNEKP